MFRSPELGFACIPEDFRHRASFARLHAIVQVLETPAQLGTQSSSHAGLAGTHKAHQHKRPHRRPPAGPGRVEVPARTWRAFHAGSSPGWRLPAIPGDLLAFLEVDS